MLWKRGQRKNVAVEILRNSSIENAISHTAVRLGVFPKLKCNATGCHHTPAVFLSLRERNEVRATKRPISPVIKNRPKIVLTRGFEPPRVSPYGPEPYASAIPPREQCSRTKCLPRPD